MDKYYKSERVLVSQLKLRNHQEIYQEIPIYNSITSFYTELWHSLHGRSLKDFESNLRKIKIISFNYDRLFKYFLYSSAKNFFGDSATQEIIRNNLNITHVYGRLSFLDFENLDKGTVYGDGNLVVIQKLDELIQDVSLSQIKDDKYFNFKFHTLVSNAIRLIKKGSEEKELKKQLEFLFASINNIKTYGESLNIDKNEITIDKATINMYFLGFSFHPLNTELLSQRLSFEGPPPHAYTSSTGMKNGQIWRVYEDLDKRWYKDCSNRNRVRINNGEATKGILPYHDLSIPELFDCDDRFNYL